MLRPFLRLRLRRANPVLACVLVLAMGLGVSFSAAGLTHWQRGGNAPVLVELARAEVARTLSIMLANLPEHVSPQAGDLAVPAPAALAKAQAAPAAFALWSIPPPARGA